MNSTKVESIRRFDKVDNVKSLKNEMKWRHK